MHLAYHNNPEIKRGILAQLYAHHSADEIVKGRYWEGGKGCAVGCTIHSGNHAEYETRFGIPQALAHLEDGIFEGLPNKRAKCWPIEFMSSIRPGADLSMICARFLYWLLTDELSQRVTGYPKQRAVVQRVASLYARLIAGDSPKQSEWESAARSAQSAQSAARSAARSARSVQSVQSAWSAAESATQSAWSAAWSAARSAARSAQSAARSAAWSAAWSAAESAARSAAWSATYERMADKLLQLLSNAE